MTGRHLVDISQTLWVGMPGWPGDTAFAAEASRSHGPDCPVRVLLRTCDLVPHRALDALIAVPIRLGGLDAAPVRTVPRPLS